MSQIIKLTEQDIRNIVNEVLGNYTDSGEFTPIGNQYNGIGSRPHVQSENGRLLKILNSISSKLYTEAKYMAKICNIQNPMFIKKIEDPAKRKEATIAQTVYSKCMDLYDYIKNAEQELK